MNCKNSPASSPRTWGWGKMLLLGTAFALFGPRVSAQVSITATAGTPGPTSYATVNAAFTAINAGTHQGAITVSVIGNTTEPATPVPLLKSAAPSSYTSVLIRPSGGNWTINSPAAPVASRGILELVGADNVTIDGDDPGTAGVRNLTIQMVATATSGTQCIRLASNSTTGLDGADNNTVKNCILIGGRNSATTTTTSFGILMSNSTASTGGAYGSQSTLIENNLITRCYQGVSAIGSSASYLNPGSIIRNNVMGSAVSADNIGNRGIIISYSASTAGVGSAVIQGNDIRCGENGTTGFGSSVAGVEASTANAGLTIDGNNIHDVRQPSTSGYHAIGIYITGSTSNSGITIRNNFIRDMVSSLYTTSITTTGDTYGVYFSAGATNVNIDNNTIALQVDPTTGTLTNHINACVAATVNGVTIASFRNNILVNTLSSINSYGLYCVATGNISAGAVNNNNYYVPNGKVGYYNAAARTTLGDWQTATGKDGASINYPGPFVSATDLHVDLSNGNAAFFNGTGATGTGVTTDIDGDTRGNPPDIGADEFILLTCAGADGGTITPATASACSGGTYVMSSTGVTTGAGISNQWLVSSTSGGPYVPVSGGSGATSASYTTGALATGTYYYVLRNTCTTGPVSDDSNELTLTVNPTPSATATNNGPACVGGSVTFDGVPSTAGTYAWSGPNGYTSALEDPTRTGLVLTDAGIYSFTVTVLGCPSAAATTSVAVINAPTIASTTATPNPTCFNGSSQLNVVASQPTAANQLAYTYSTGQSLDPMTGATTLVASGVDDTPGATILLPFPVVFNNNTYTYFAASPDGWMVLNTTATTAPSQFTNAVTSTANTPKLYPYWDDLATGTNGNVSYVVTGTTPNRILKVQWFVPIPRNTTGTANSTFQAWVYETSGSVEYRYGTMAAGSMSASVGLTASATNYQSVTVSTNTVSTSTANDANAGQPLSGTMYRFAGSVLSYSWSPSTFIAGQEALPNPVATNVTAASTAYTVTVSNGSCPVTGTVTLTTSAPISAATISGNLSYCEGLSTTLTAVPTDGAGPYSYLWSPGGQVTVSIVVSAPGNYSAQVTDNCGGSVNTGAVTVTQNAKPTPVISPSGPVSFCGSGVLTSSIATGNVWTPGGATTQNVTVAASGSYTVTVTDGNGCIGTSAPVAVTVSASPTGVTANASDLIVCDGDLVDLTSSATMPNQTILSENFNGAAAGWTTLNSSTTTGSGNPALVAWTLRPNSYNTGGSWNTVLNSNDASQFYLTNSDAGGSGISGLTFLSSPVMNLSNYTTASLAFYHYYRDLGANDTARVQVTINGGTTWTDAQVYNTTTGAPTAFVVANISLNAYVGQSAVQFRFRYRSGWDYGWAVDNLTVTGMPAPNYSWTSVPVGFTSNVQNPTGVAVSPVPTTYTVTVTANGCPTSASVTVNPDNTDTDNDGTPDCSDACPNDPNKIAAGTCGCGNPEPGATCDDGNPLTINDVIDATCSCAGTLLVNDCLGVPGGSALPGTACDDGSACTTGDVYDANCACTGTAVNTDDGDPCTLDSCDPINGVSHVFQDADGDGTCDANDLCPGGAEPGSACDDGNANTTGDVIDANCACVGTPVGSCTGNEVVVAIFTDNTPQDITWVITNASNVTIASGGPTAGQANTLVLTTACLGAAPVSDCYGFKLMDASGNGITGGYWQLRSLGGRVLLGDDFANGANSPSLTPANASYTAHSFCLPVGNTHIAARSCGIFNFTPNSNVYCTNAPGATSNQFEFSDPDAGFIRRITVNTNKVRFNQMVTSPLTPGVKYFVRARNNAAGPVTDAHFGGGCEVAMSSTIPCTELISAPQYGHSCNETRAFNPSTNNSFIYAQPVNGATEYQFRISIPGEGYDETFIRSTYILQLKWNATVAPPLVNGSTYNVQVNVKVGTLYSGFCGDVCTITIDNSALRPEASMMQGNGTATLWPNPVRESQVNLSIDGIQDADQNITVDIQDIYGKQVFAKEFGNSGERFSTILDLPGDVASGVYMVNITVNGKRTVQRLSIIR